MKLKPTSVYEHDSWQTSYDLFQNKHLHHIPIIDKNGCIKGVKFIDELFHNKQKQNWVVLMAGGIGSRLSPLTDKQPKPLLKVGNKPLLETILESFIEQGFYQFYISFSIVFVIYYL